MTSGGGGGGGGNDSVSFYRRELPCPPAVAFSSREGKQLFAEALAGGGLACYFELAAQFSTQTEPAFCALGSLTVALNALSVDPGRVWKGPWRWFQDTMLDCCQNLDLVSAQGLTLDEAACLARCNGARALVRRPLASEREPENPVDPGANAHGHSGLSVGADGTCCGSVKAFFDRERQGLASFEKFKADVLATCLELEAAHSGKECSEGRPLQVMVVSYSRRTFGQTGTGHFSPIAGYHAQRDMVLILDVARFKYPPHWVPLTLLWKSMQTKDERTGKPRGYLVMSHVDGLSVGALLRFSCQSSRWHAIYSYWVLHAPSSIEPCSRLECKGPGQTCRQDTHISLRLVQLLGNMPGSPEDLLQFYTEEESVNREEGCEESPGGLEDSSQGQQDLGNDKGPRGPSSRQLVLEGMRRLPLYALVLHVLTRNSHLAEQWADNRPEDPDDERESGPAYTTEERALVLVGLVMALDSGNAGHALWKWTPGDERLGECAMDSSHSLMAHDATELAEQVGEIGMKALKEEAAHLNYQLVALESMAERPTCNRQKC